MSENFEDRIIKLENEIHLIKKWFKDHKSELPDISDLIEVDNK